LISHGTPKRSTTTPNAGDQNIFCSQSNDRAAGVAQGDGIAGACRRTQTRRAALDEARRDGFRAAELLHTDVTEPVRTCAACDRGLGQRDDPVSPSPEHGVVERGGGFDVGGAKQVACEAWRGHGYALRTG
jgi:hypothetical protein